MYIFLDESKSLNKKWWKFILSWIITSLKPWTIDKIYNEFLNYSWITESWGEIKSCDRKYQVKIQRFHYYIKHSKYSEQIQFIWVFSKNYKENWENYYKSLKILLTHTLRFSKIINKNFNTYNIIADNIKLNYKEEKIKSLLNNDSNLSNWNKFKFIFANSKKYWWIKIADFIAWRLWNTYIKEKELLESDFIEYFVNEEISFVILE